MDSKRCSHCREVKPITEFWNKTRGGTDKQNQCKLCNRASQAAYQKTSKGLATQDKYRKSRKALNTRLRREYGITDDAVTEALMAQGHKCASCAESFLSTKSMHIDHDHRTKQFRGVLCQRCNMALGLMRDDIAIIRGLADYVMKFREA